MFAKFSLGRLAVMDPDLFDLIICCHAEKSSETLPITLVFVEGMLLSLLICSIVMRKTLKSAIFGGRVTQAIHNECVHYNFNLVPVFFLVCLVSVTCDHLVYPCF